MKDMGWVSAAVYDLRDSTISLFDYKDNPFEVSILLNSLESMPHTLLSIWKRKVDGFKEPMLYDYNTVFIGENLRAFIAANTKKKTKIEMPWDSKTPNNIRAKVIKGEEEARRMFPAPKPPPRKKSNVENEPESERIIGPTKTPTIN